MVQPIADIAEAGLAYLGLVNICGKQKPKGTPRFLHWPGQFDPSGL